MKSSYIISIPTPCHESWEEMTTTEQGQFCQNCQKTVTDFSTLNDKELLSFFSNPQKNVCGRFRPGQLNREISMPANSRREPMISIAAMVASLSVIIPSVQAKSKVEKIQITPDRSTANTTPIRVDTIPRIKGIVRDGTNNIVLPKVLVKVKGHDISTYTDSLGKFELEIPSTFTDTTVILQIKYIGFIMENVIVPLSCGISTPDIPMQNIKLQVSVVGGTGVTIVTRKATLWERFKYKVGQLFH